MMESEIRKILTFVIRKIASEIFGENSTEALVRHQVPLG